MNDPSPGDMIAKYAELKAYVEAEEAVFNKSIKPYKDAMRAIQVACGVALQDQGLQNFKTDDGTAYLRHDLGVKVDNQPDFLNFVRVHERWDLADIKPLKDPVVEYADKNEGKPPPGVSFNPSVTCIIRK
ncbi:MAG: hypothetical protein KGL35_24795 [Bradyrhizobium sp.]|nr:hypothetical protein [Bradyrhizobium sp.]